MRTRLKRVLGLGVLAGLAYALWRAWRARVPAPSTDGGWDVGPFPFPPVPRPHTMTVRPEVEPTAVERDESPQTAVAGSSDVDAWTAANPDGSCPTTHPVKAKLASGIFHEPGGANYNRTHADRCYVDADAAVADGLRRSKV